MKGCLLKKNIFIIIYGSLLTIASSCASINTPSIFHQKLTTELQSTTTTSTAKNWVLDSLTPSENTVFFKKHTTAISVYMEAHGDGNYLLQLCVNGKCFKALPYTFIRGNGEVDFYGYIKWFIKPKKKTTFISVALYRTDNSASGKTKICTLLKQINREYEVKCHNSK